MWGFTYPPAAPVALEEPEPVAPSAILRAATEKKRGEATARALLIMVVRSMVSSCDGETVWWSALKTTCRRDWMVE